MILMIASLDLERLWKSFCGYKETLSALLRSLFMQVSSLWQLLCNPLSYHRTSVFTIVKKQSNRSQKLTMFSQFSSVQSSHSVMSDCLRPYESQHARPPCPSPTPGVHSDSHPSRRWCYTAISSSVVPFSSCPQSLPASESFPMSQLFTWGSQSTGVSALASFLPMNTQDWSPLEWTGWISLQSKGLSRVFSNTTVRAQLSSQSNSHIHTWPLEKP